MIGRKPDIEKILIFEMHCEMRILGCEMRILGCEMRILGCEMRTLGCEMRAAVAENSKSPYAVLAQGEEREFAIRYENEGLE